MNIMIEAQHAVALDEPRGVGYYSIQLIQALLRRKVFDYGLSFFDFAQENGNRLRAEQRFGMYHVPLFECRDLDYRVAIRDEHVYDHKSYHDYTGATGDLFHFMNFITLPTNLQGKKLTTIHDLNWIGYAEGTSATLLPLLKISLDRMLRIQPDIVADSYSTQNEIRQYTNTPKETIHVVYPAFDNENLFPDKENRYGVPAPVEAGCEYVFFIGTFERKKNIVRIVEAFNQIAARFSGLRLVLAGKPTWDDPEPIYRAIQDSPYTDRIIVPGYVSTDEKRLLYSNALCFVFPSICEGFGIPVLEAMACGCPVITADNTSLPEVGGDAAAYVDASRVDQLAYEMERIVSTESLRKEMRAKGFRQAEKFTWDQSAEQIEKVYWTLLER
ncbi:MAG: glycosyltransferase family 4 protein [Clostridiales bacterium]|nr:glycosyltransferase family 4 protein [Clostridiales bacterium]